MDGLKKINLKEHLRLLNNNSGSGGNWAPTCFGNRNEIKNLLCGIVTHLPDINRGVTKV